MKVKAALQAIFTVLKSSIVITVVGLLALALLALVAWGALGGSLLLAQLALMLATVCGVAVLWAWRATAVSPASLLPLLLTGVALALCLAWLPAGGSAASPGADGDDPYYAPAWR